jgi:hypothetical protein
MVDVCAVELSNIIQHNATIFDTIERTKTDKYSDNIR